MKDYRDIPRGIDLNKVRDKVFRVTGTRPDIQTIAVIISECVDAGLIEVCRKGIDPGNETEGENEALPIHASRTNGH